MAKSRIIKDLANGDADVFKALKRLKVLMSNLEESEVSSWINNELTGYPDPMSLPEYRVTHGSLVGTFFIGNQYNRMQYTKCPIPISKENEDIRDVILRIPVTESVPSIKALISSGKELSRPIPPEFYHILQEGTTITSIVSASVLVSVTFFQEILAKVESILIDVLCTLEKQFGILDDLDIDFTDDSVCKADIIHQLTQYIFVDNSTRIGDNNRINDSEIG